MYTIFSSFIKRADNLEQNTYHSWPVKINSFYILRKVYIDNLTFYMFDLTMRVIIEHVIKLNMFPLFKTSQYKLLLSIAKHKLWLCLCLCVCFGLLFCFCQVVTVILGLWLRVWLLHNIITYVLFHRISTTQNHTHCIAISFHVSKYEIHEMPTKIGFLVKTNTSQRINICEYIHVYLEHL